MHGKTNKLTNSPLLLLIRAVSATQTKTEFSSPKDENKMAHLGRAKFISLLLETGGRKLARPARLLG